MDKSLKSPDVIDTPAGLSTPLRIYGFREHDGMDRIICLSPEGLRDALIAHLHLSQEIPALTWSDTQDLASPALIDALIRGYEAVYGEEPKVWPRTPLVDPNDLRYDDLGEVYAEYLGPYSYGGQMLSDSLLDGLGQDTPDAFVPHRVISAASLSELVDRLKSTGIQLVHDQEMINLLQNENLDVEEVLKILEELPVRYKT